MLHYSGVRGFKTVLQYSLLGSSVLQYTALYCGWKGCRRPGCIAMQPGVSWHETGLPVSQDRQPCRDTAGWALVRAGVGAGRAGLGAGALGRQVRRRGQARGRGRGRKSKQASARGRRAAAGRRRAVAARGRARQARGLDAGCPGWPGLCTWCTRPVFGPVRLGIFPESIF